MPYEKIRTLSPTLNEWFIIFIKWRSICVLFVCDDTWWGLHFSSRGPPETSVSNHLTQPRRPEELCPLCVHVSLLVSDLEQATLKCSKFLTTHLKQVIFFLLGSSIFIGFTFSYSVTVPFASYSPFLRPTNSLYHVCGSSFRKSVLVSVRPFLFSL